MNTPVVTDEEYNKLVKTVEFFDTTRNQLLTFSFTAVLTVFGVAISIDRSINPVIYLLPYFLIIPFSARISYYRLASAHINSFLKTFSPERMNFAKGTELVPENYGFLMYRPIAWLVNHEMVILSLVPAITFWAKCSVQITKWAMVDLIIKTLPFEAVVFVYLISDSTYNYEKLYETYENGWKKYKLPSINDSKKKS